jgi:hypothetical protein
MELSLEHMLELLEDKMVRTTKGSYISVDDLKQLQKDFKEAKDDQEPKGTAKTLLGARKALSEDPEFLAQFNQEPKAPADAAVVKRVGAESEDQAA